MSDLDSLNYQRPQPRSRGAFSAMNVSYSSGKNFLRRKTYFKFMECLDDGSVCSPSLIHQLFFLQENDLKIKNTE